MSTSMETQTGRERRWIYITTSVLLAVLVVGALLTFSAARSTQVAQEKAQELIAAVEAAGGYAPSSDVIVQLLGDDGGAVCADPNAALSKATLLAQLSTGASGPGSRPIIADSRAVQGQLMIIEVYCPDELAEFQEFVDSLQLDDQVAGS